MLVVAPLGFPSARWRLVMLWALVGRSQTNRSSAMPQSASRRRVESRRGERCGYLIGWYPLVGVKERYPEIFPSQPDSRGTALTCAGIPAYNLALMTGGNGR